MSESTYIKGNRRKSIANFLPLVKIPPVGNVVPGWISRADVERRRSLSPRKKAKSSSSRRGRREREASWVPPEPGRSAQAAGLKLQTYQVGALPLINHVLERMQLERLLGEYLPPDDPRA